MRTYGDYRIFSVGDIVQLSDGSLDRVIGFDCGNGAVLGRTGGVGYRTVHIIGHAWDRWDYRNDDVVVTLFIIGQ